MRFASVSVLLAILLTTSLATAQQLAECLDPQSASDLSRLVGNATLLSAAPLSPRPCPDGTIAYCSLQGDACWYVRIEADGRFRLSADSAFSQELSAKLMRPVRAHRLVESVWVSYGATRVAAFAFAPVNCVNEGCENRFQLFLSSNGSVAPFILPDATPFVPLSLRLYAHRNKLAILSSERVMPNRWRFLFGPEDFQRELDEYVGDTRQGTFKICRVDE